MKRMTITLVGSADALANTISFLMRNDKLDIVSLSKSDTDQPTPPAATRFIPNGNGIYRAKSVKKRVSTYDKHSSDPRAVWIGEGSRAKLDVAGTLENIGLTMEQLRSMKFHRASLECALKQADHASRTIAIK